MAAKLSPRPRQARRLVRCTRLVCKRWGEVSLRRSKGVGVSGEPEYALRSNCRRLAGNQGHEGRSCVETEGGSADGTRPIRHWVYFRSPSDRDVFLHSVQERFDKAEPLLEANGELRFGLVLTHTGLPDYLSMNATTLLLSRTARQCNATYDGWETEVRRSS